MKILAVGFDHKSHEMTLLLSLPQCVRGERLSDDAGDFFSRLFVSCIQKFWGWHPRLAHDIAPRLRNSAT